MGSLFTFALGAVSALILVPVIVKSKHRHRHRHAGATSKRVVAKKTGSAKKAGTAKGGRKKGK